jgi:hypothetical protein
MILINNLFCFLKIFAGNGNSILGNAATEFHGAGFHAHPNKQMLLFLHSPVDIEPIHILKLCQ